MLTAEEARKITDVTSTRELIKELRSVEDGITEAAKSNRYEYTCFASIHPQIIKALEGSGYKVRQEKGKNGGTITCVRWQ